MSEPTTQTLTAEALARALLGAIMSRSGYYVFGTFDGVADDVRGEEAVSQADLTAVGLDGCDDLIAIAQLAIERLRKAP